MSHDKIARASRQVLEIDRAVPADILEWVEEQLAFGCSAIVMRQRADSSSDVVRTWDLVGADARVVTASIDDTAHSEGRYMRGPTLFVLYSQLPNSRDYVARKTLRIEGQMFSASGETEPPNENGIVSMLMRHTDASIQISLGHTSHIIEQYKGMLGASQRRVLDLEKDIAKFAADREALRLHEHEHALDVVKAQDSAKNGEFVREQVGLIVPVIANRFLKANVGARSPAVTDEALSRLMGSFSDDQLAGLSTVLSSQQMIAVMDLYMAYAARSKDGAVAEQAKFAAEDAHAKANGTTTNGSRPAAARKDEGEGHG
jgi:hypothetical protein